MTKYKIKYNPLQNPGKILQYNIRNIRIRGYSMEVKVIYLDKLNKEDKLFFNNRLKVVLESLEDDIYLEGFEEIFVLNTIEELYELIKGEDLIFNETNGIREDNVSHLTVYSHRNNSIRAFLIIKDMYISNSNGKDVIDDSEMNVKIYSEIIKISDDLCKIRDGLSEVVLNSDGNFNIKLRITSNTIWKEYYAAKRASKFIVYKDIIDFDKLIEVINIAKENSDYAIDYHEDNDGLNDEIEVYATNVLRKVGENFGYIHGLSELYGPDFMKNDKVELDKRINKLYLAEIWNDLEMQLALLSSKYIIGQDAEDLDELGKLVFKTWLELGVEIDIFSYS